MLLRAFFVCKIRGDFGFFLEMICVKSRIFCMLLLPFENDPKDNSKGRESTRLAQVLLNIRSEVTCKQSKACSG